MLATVIAEAAVKLIRALNERLGYAAFGDEFDDAGIPHRCMAKPLH